jgi:hypothetical protein
MRSLQNYATAELSTGAGSCERQLRRREPTELAKGTPKAHRFSRHPAKMIICRTLATYKGQRFNGSAAILIGRIFRR